MRQERNRSAEAESEESQERGKDRKEESGIHNSWDGVFGRADFSDLSSLSSLSFGILGVFSPVPSPTSPPSFVGGLDLSPLPSPSCCGVLGVFGRLESSLVSPSLFEDVLGVRCLFDFSPSSLRVLSLLCFSVKKKRNKKNV